MKIAFAILGLAMFAYAGVCLVIGWREKNPLAIPAALVALAVGVFAFWIAGAA